MSSSIASLLRQSDTRPVRRGTIARDGNAPSFAAHRDDAAVAAAEAAAHDALDRDLTGPAVFHGDARGRGEHPFGPQAYIMTGASSRLRRQTAIERRDDAARLAAGCRLRSSGPARRPGRGRNRGRRARCRTPRPVEQRGFHVARAQRLRQRCERRQADAAGDHPRFGRQVDDGERAPERAEAAMR